MSHLILICEVICELSTNAELNIVLQLSLTILNCLRAFFWSTTSTMMDWYGVIEHILSLGQGKVCSSAWIIIYFHSYSNFYIGSQKTPMYVSVPFPPLIRAPGKKRSLAFSTCYEYMDEILEFPIESFTIKCRSLLDMTVFRGK